MRFLPWQFARTPPQTVPSPAPVVPLAEAAPATSSTGSSTNTSRATCLISQFGDLAGTAQYLQSIILSLTKGLGVTVNTSSNPDLGRALSSIYGSVPPAVSIQMYSALLDVEFGAQQVLHAAGPDSSLQPNPFQQQAVVTVNKAVESALAAAGDFNTQAPLMLRNLKTQAAVYTQWQNQLASYPAAGNPSTALAANVIQASTVDVGDDLNAVLSDHVAAMTSTYAAAFTMLAGIPPVSQDIVGMVATFAELSTAELAQIQSLFNLTKNTSCAESIQDSSTGLTSCVFVQMLSDAAAMVFSLDRITQMALEPLGSMTNSLGNGMTSVQSQAGPSLVGVIRQVSSTARLASGPLAGMLTSNSAAGSTSGPSGMTQGMQDLSTLLDWSLQQANGKTSSSLNSFTKLMRRTQSDTSSQVQMLSTINSLGTLASLAGAFLTQQQSSGAAASTSVTQLATVGAILAATVTGNGTTYTVQSGVVTVNPPYIPPPTLAAAAVLSNAGVQTSLAGLSQPL
jgi:hypothetical protein